MIDKLLEDIAFDDIDRFVQEKRPEGKTVDYKRDSYGGKDEDKKELLKDVSSFANTLGGDIVIGVDEDKGVPTGIPGVTLPDVDKEKLRLEGIIRQGLEPRVEFGIHHVATTAATSVFVIRVKESLLLPHRVVFQGKFGEFWARSSAGKYSMDTDELRRAFTLSDSIYEQIRDFRRHRVAQIVADETPVSMMPGGKLLLHLIPVSSFRSRQAFDVASMPKLSSQFQPMAASSGWSSRLNLDGNVAYLRGPNGNGCRSYTQFFRNGIVEAVLSEIVQEDEDDGKLLLADYYERYLLFHNAFFNRLLSGLREVGIQPPIWCFLAITGVKGARIPANHYRDEYRSIDRDVLSLPECVIHDLDADAAGILRPMFDLIWNASGYSNSPNFDQDGNWVGR